MSVVINLHRDEVHDPLYLFSDGNFIYFVNEAIHDSFMNESRESHRKTLADIIVDIDSKRVVKSRHF
jgi:hypothetical protein